MNNERQDYTEKWQRKIDEYVELEEFEKAQKLTDVLKTHAEAQKMRKETEMAVMDRKVAVANTIVQGSNALIELIGFAVHGRWIRMGFKFESTGSISGKTTNKVFLPGKI